MALSFTQDSGLHKFRAVTDKQGAYVECWCGKRHFFDFTWGIKRLIKGLNDWLIEHEGCEPRQEQKAVRSA